MPWPTLAPEAPPDLAPPAHRPTFSVIMAVYQGADHVGDALRSVSQQSEAPLEVVVCDDGSTDDLDAALAPFLDRITLLRQANQGEGVAKNRAVEAATGDYVVILDADDAWEPERLAALRELAEARPDLDVLTTDAWFEVDGRRQGRFYGDEMAFPLVDQELHVLDRCFVMPHAAVRRARWLELGGFDVTMSPAADWDFYLRAVLSGSRVGVVDEPLARYRLRPGSMSADRAVSLGARVRVMDKTRREQPLTPAVASALEQARHRHARRAALAEAESAIRRGGPGARRAAVALARTPGVGRTTRVKGLLAAVAPGLARRALTGRAADRLSRPLT